MKTDPIRVFVVDDHPMVRHGVQAMLASEGDMRWVGSAPGGSEALQMAPAAAPDVLLMDLAMPQMDGVAAMTALRPLLPATRFVALANVADPAETRRALAAGAAAILLKNASTAELVSTIRASMNSQLDQAAAGLPFAAPAPGDGDLTRRERELLILMARGESNLEIARHLGIAMPTVKFHVTNILAKLRAGNRTEAVLIGLRRHLVGLD